MNEIDRMMAEAIRDTINKAGGKLKARKISLKMKLDISIINSLLYSCRDRFTKDEKFFWSNISE